MRTNFKRDDLLKKWNEQIENHEILLITSAGIGITAKCQEYAGADAILVDHTARMRMASYGSAAGLFAYKNSTEDLYHEAEDILPLLKKTPAIAGITAAEPFRVVEQVIDDMISMGFTGICNSPSTGWNDEMNTKNLNKLGLGYDTEVDMIRKAHEKGILTMAICYLPEQSEAMARAGADIIVADIGFTVGGLIGVKTAHSFEKTQSLIQSICDSAKAINASIITLCHGGILNNPEIVAEMLNSLEGVAGFLGGSATDRLPMEEGMIKTAKGFKADKLYGF